MRDSHYDDWYPPGSNPFREQKLYIEAGFNSTPPDRQRICIDCEHPCHAERVAVHKYCDNGPCECLLCGCDRCHGTAPRVAYLSGYATFPAMRVLYELDCHRKLARRFTP